MSTIGDLLGTTTARLRDAGSPSPRLDAELLLGFALGIHRTALLAHLDGPVGPAAAERLEVSVVRREAGEPVAYIRGFKEFHGLAISVDPRALIPRPETETLVDAAIAAIMRRLGARSGGRPASAGGDRPEPIRIADVGTGSGAIVVAIAAALRAKHVEPGRDVTFLATDVSPDALDVARENAVGHGLADGMRFVEADLLPPVLPGGEPLDLLLANLPYVRSDAIAGLPIAASFEPRLALDGGADGLDVIRGLLERLPDVLRRDGEALLEIGADQGETASTAAVEALPEWRAEVSTDLAGLPRVLRLNRP